MLYLYSWNPVLQRGIKGEAKNGWVSDFSNKKGGVSEIGWLFTPYFSIVFPVSWEELKTYWLRKI